MSKLVRCAWAKDDLLLQKYHDEVWAVPCFDDRKIFKMLTLEIFQAGLSWKIVLEKEENFEKAFDNFDIDKIINYNEEKIRTLMEDEGIIRNEKKILATIANAKVCKKVQEKYGSFSNYIWSYSYETPIINPWTDDSEVPSKSHLGNKITEDMKELGFEFIGETTIHSFLQAIGVLNDHINSCDFKYID